MIDGPAGLKVICGISDPTERRVGAAADPLICVNILERLQYTSEVVLVDCSAGVSSLVTSLALAGDRLLLVTTPEPTALADAYALLKLIHLKGFAGRVGLVVNMAGHRVAQDAFRRLERTARQFLQLDVQNWGAVPLDRHVTTAVSKRVPVVARYPRCPASLALAEIARQLVPPRISTRNHGMWTRVASLFL
jgi:flagellar biosynthesis protein FlhG